MSRALMTCQKCYAKKFESEVVFDTTIKDFVCRDKLSCENPKTKRRLGRKNPKLRIRN